MRCVVDRNVVMRRMTVYLCAGALVVLSTVVTKHTTCLNIQNSTNHSHHVTPIHRTQ